MARERTVNSRPPILRLCIDLLDRKFREPHCNNVFPCCDFTPFLVSENFGTPMDLVRQTIVAGPNRASHWHPSIGDQP